MFHVIGCHVVFKEGLCFIEALYASATLTGEVHYDMYRNGAIYI